MTITDRQEAYKPFLYENYFDYYKTALATVWRPETVNMAQDMFDFTHKSTKVEKHVIKSILKTFTILEIHISDYWSDRVCKMFPRHEIVASARAFAFQEAIHAQAYDWLNSSLGIDNYSEFLGDSVALKKIGQFIGTPNNLVSLAVFSGAGEGVSLFASFSILLSMSLNGRYKGLAQIISWSVREEVLHSQMGCELFRDLVSEKGISDEDKASVYQGFKEVVANEFAQIDQIFEIGELDNVKSKNLKDYVLYRANNRLATLGLEPQFEPTGQYKAIKDWFEPMVLGQSDNDFFSTAAEGGNYAAILSQSFNDYDYTQTPLKRWDI